MFNMFDMHDTGIGLQLNKNMQFLQKVYKKHDDSIAFFSLVINAPQTSVAAAPSLVWLPSRTEHGVLLSVGSTAHREYDDNELCW